MAYIFFPILLNGLYSIFYEKGRNNYLLTIGAVGILLSHNISTLLAVIMSIMYIVCNMKRLFNKECRVQIWKNLIVNAIFVILLVLFFYVPFMEHITMTQYVATQEGNMSSKEKIATHALYIYQLVFGEFQSGNSEALDNGFDNEMLFSLGLPIIIPLLFTPFVINKIEKEKKQLYISTLIIGIAFAFMSTTLFPWENMPNIMIMIQFPWRMLLIATILLSIVAGINISKCFENLNKETILVLTLIISIYTVQYISNVMRFNIKFDESYLGETNKIEDINEIDQYCVGFEYLPVKAKTEYTQNRESGIIVLSGDAVIKEEKKEKNNMTFVVEENLQGSNLELPYIFYLGYDIRLNGNKILYQESEHGFISVNISKNETGIVEVAYKGTTLSKLAYIISGITAMIFVAYIICGKRRLINND